MPSMVLHICSTTTGEIEATELGVQDHFLLSKHPKVIFKNSFRLTETSEFTHILTHSLQTVSTPAERYICHQWSPHSKHHYHWLRHTSHRVSFWGRIILYVCTDSGLAAQLPCTHSEEDRERCCTICVHCVKLHRCDDWFNKKQDGQ